MYHSFDHRIWFTDFLFLFLSKKVTLSSKYEFYLLNRYIFFSVPVIMNRITKMHSNCFDGAMSPDYLLWFVNSICGCPSP